MSPLEIARNRHTGFSMEKPFTTKPKKKWLSPREAAEYVGLSVDHLARLRVQGDGPRFAKTARGRSGAIRYPDTELDAWMTARMRTSTSETAA